MRLLRVLPLLLVLFTAAPARADWWFGGSHGGSSGGEACSVGCGVFFGLTFGLDLVVDVVDIVVLAQHDFISPGWSVVQGLWGLAHAVIGTVVTAAGGLGLGLGAKDAGTVFTLGLVTLGEGIFLVVVAIVSTVRFFAERRHRREEERRHPAVPVASVSVDPVRGGGSALLTWRF
jgi:hypothetical protein